MQNILLSMYKLKTHVFWIKHGSEEKSEGFRKSLEMNEITQYITIYAVYLKQCSSGQLKHYILLLEMRKDLKSMHFNDPLSIVVLILLLEKSSIIFPSCTFRYFRRSYSVGDEN